MDCRAMQQNRRAEAKSARRREAPPITFCRTVSPILLLLPWGCYLYLLLSSPSCSPVSPEDARIRNLQVNTDDQLKAMVVADLHLTGPRSAWLDRIVRESFMEFSFHRAYITLKPHTLFILGDLSDWGRKSTDEQWKSVVHRFLKIAKPFLGLPYHVSVGNHDIGDFYQITPALIRRFARSFPGLDETGSSTIMIKNVSFVSLNAMALACDGCPMHASMQNVVEAVKKNLQFPTVKGLSANRFRKPILLSHLPLYREDESVCNTLDIPRCAPWHELEGDCLPLFTSSRRPLKLTAYRSMMDMLSINTSRYLLSTLRPSLVLSAHAHHFCDRLFEDGTREVTVSTFTWRNRDDPSFLLVYVYKDGSHSIDQCFLPRESFTMLLLILGAALIGLLILGISRCRVKLRTEIRSH